MNTRTKSRIAFTLVELLMVITVISMLTGLLMSGVHAARDSAKKAAAKVEVTSMAMALQAYYNEYGMMPNIKSPLVTDTNVTLTATKNERLLSMLMGADIYLDPSDPPKAGGNPRRYNFLNVKDSSKGLVSGVYTKMTGASLTNIVNRWGRSVMVHFDYDGDNIMTLPMITDNPMGFPTKTIVTGSVAVWTVCGKNSDTYICSWK